ncbi:hypothetical protein GWR56_19000 [Mucilaginibacter sp. 14171R-50]|uniref:hypothetical protein n=1 Tax=Mucilaginibacter sp. 14171R-50 TaxID=2703789 RepID=UPI00138BA66F|nr:hypothetical protein [Mucilaginibacter sp. 14171R-50]QHS57530.1 hypothetical protein GWR56_19000 [Mucilaginibacter sp. 14171R-50]
MKVPATSAVLKLVISKGFRYCYSRTTCVDSAEADVCITLTPIAKSPHIRRLPKAYDTFFNILKEPVQMAAGVDSTLVYFDLDKSIITT